MEISLKNNQNYYIQRVERHYDEFNEGRKGLDYYVTFDYMGSSEFEWGRITKIMEVHERKCGPIQTDHNPYGIGW